MKNALFAALHKKKINEKYKNKNKKMTMWIEYFDDYDTPRYEYYT